MSREDVFCKGRTTVMTNGQRIYILERRAGIDQDGACNGYLGCGENCGKQAGHAERGDPKHLSARDSAFVPWGPDWPETPEAEK